MPTPADRPDPRYGWLRRLLFRLDAETAHTLAIGFLRLAGALPVLLPLAGARRRRDDPRLAVERIGLRFPSPLGLAAGFDKDGVALAGLTRLGFGFLEVGTVTPRPQPGNPRPRMFRYPEARSLENRLGFNNAGGAALGRRLAAHRRQVPIGVNVGRNKTTPPERSAEDYLQLLGELSERADYFTINLSSPNTPGLRDLQTPEVVAELLTAGRRRTPRPLLVKLSPDLAAGRAAELALAAVEAGAAGIILANTTTDYAAVPGCRGQGGLSGEVLRERSYALLREVAPAVGGRALLVSVGGVDSGREVYRRLRAGAGLVQLYTALVFQGPGLVGRIQDELLEQLERAGLPSVEAAIGADLRR